MRLLLSLCVFVALSNAYRTHNFKSIFLDRGRIIGGTPAKQGQFPYQVGLQIKIENFFGFVTCGGSLISKNYVLTATHCVRIDQIEHIEVHLGALVLLNNQHTVVVVPKENFIAHEKYNPQTFENDIALLKLPQDVQFTDTIQPIALPTRSDINLDLENKYLVISGWGRYSDDLQSNAQTLQYAEVKVLNQRICMHFFDEVLPSMICTNTRRGKGTCHGDSGGPLAYTDPNTKRTFIAGLTSFGNNISCVKAGWPSVFTRITHYLDWIAEHTDIVIQA